MKKSFFALCICAAIISCNKAADDTQDDTVNIGYEDAGLLDPAPNVLNADGQRARFKNVGNELLDYFNATELNNQMQDVADMVELEPFKNNGPVMSTLGKAIESMYKMNGNVYDCVYNLASLKGTYSSVNGVENVSGNDSNIIITVVANGITWEVVVNFSNSVQKVLVHSEQKVNEYVELPQTTEIIVKKNGEVFIDGKLGINTNVSDITNGYAEGMNATISSSLEFAGYAFNLARLSFNNKKAECICSISKNGKVLMSETFAASDVYFNNDEFLGGGAASAVVNIMGKIQVKVNASDVSRVMDLSEQLTSYKYNETKFKEIVDNLNSVMKAEVYFSSDVRQCYLEIYPILSSSYPQYWMAEPIFVLADGTRYSHITEFFTETYFKSVIERFEDFIGSIGLTKNSKE